MKVKGKEKKELFWISRLINQKPSCSTSFTYILTMYISMKRSLPISPFWKFGPWLWKLCSHL